MVGMKYLLVQCIDDRHSFGDNNDKTGLVSVADVTKFCDNCHDSNKQIGTPSRMLFLGQWASLEKT
jgi:hypothetical protein